MADELDMQANDVQDVTSRRTAEDYVNAVNAVIDIAEIAVSFIPGGGAAAKVATKAIRYAPAARKLVSKIPDVAPIAGQVAGKLQQKAPDAVGEQAEKLAGAAKGVAAAVGERGHAASDAIKKSFDARAQEKARREARRALLDGAGIRMSVQQFMENRATQAKLSDRAGNDYLAYCGCYAIATYAGSVKKDDYGSFRDIYIGKSQNMGQSIFADVIGAGNVDVYADVKYKQHVYVLLYPCEPEKLDVLEASLITALDADASYNAPKTKVAVALGCAN